MDRRPPAVASVNGAGLRVIVVEDEGLSRKRMARLLQEAGCQVLHAFAEGRGVLDWLARHGEVDALFLDIHMPGLDGLALLRSLEGRVPVVLVTAFTEHAVEAFDAEAVDYLLKPVTASRLERAIARVQVRRGPRPEPSGAAAAEPLRYPVPAGDGIVLLDLQKTTYFEVEDEVVWAHANGRFRTLWTTLGEVESAFPRAGMLRIHRHLLVRPEAVVGLKPAPGGRALVRLLGGEELKASRGGAPRLRQRLGL